MLSRFICCAVATVAALVLPVAAQAQFTTVIDLTDSDPELTSPNPILPGTQINMTGSTIVEDMVFGDPLNPNNNIEVNISNGLIRQDAIANPGTVFNLSGIDQPAPGLQVGQIVDRFQGNGVTLNQIEESRTGRDFVLTDSLINLSDSSRMAFGATFVDSTVNASGTVDVGSGLHITDSIINVSGSAQFGNGSSFSNTYTGSTVTASGNSQLKSSNTFINSTVVLNDAADIDFVTDITGSLTLNNTSRVENQSAAGTNAVLTLNDSSQLNNLRNIGTGVQITLNDTSTLNLSNNELIDDGAHVIVNGGRIGGQVRVADGGRVTYNATTGLFPGSFRLDNSGEVTINGGQFTSFSDTGNTTDPLGQLTLVGSGFKLNGQDITGLVNPGDTVQLTDFPRIRDSLRVFDASNTLSGRLADGSPIVLAGSFFDLSSATVTLQRAAPPATPFPTPAPVVEVTGLLQDLGDQQFRDGQTVNVRSGGLLGSNVNVSNAINGVTFNIEGQVGARLNTADSTINVLDGGEVLSAITAGAGSTVNLSGGSINQQVNLFVDSTMNQTGGTARTVTATQGGTYNLHDGTVQTVGASQTGGTLNIFGGTVTNQLFASGGFESATDPNFLARVNVWGGQPFDGTFGVSFSNAEVNLFGSRFFIDNVDITSSLTLGSPAPVDLSLYNNDAILSGILDDGESFSLTLNEDGLQQSSLGSLFSNTNINLNLTEPTAEITFSADPPSDPATADASLQAIGGNGKYLPVFTPITPTARGFIEATGFTLGDDVIFLIDIDDANDDPAALQAIADLINGTPGSLPTALLADVDPLDTDLRLLPALFPGYDLFATATAAGLGNDPIYFEWDLREFVGAGGDAPTVVGVGVIPEPAAGALISAALVALLARRQRD